MVTNALPAVNWESWPVAALATFFTVSMLCCRASNFFDEEANFERCSNCLVMKGFLWELGMNQSSCFDEGSCLRLQLRHVNTDVAVKDYMT